MMFEELLEIADDGSNDVKTIANRSGDEYEVTNTEVVQRSRLWEDDSQIVELLLRKSYDKENPRIEIVVTAD
jgi:Holliday junction resolvase RusA-like endonuclease